MNPTIVRTLMASVLGSLKGGSLRKGTAAILAVGIAAALVILAIKSIPDASASNIWTEAQGPVADTYQPPKAVNPYYEITPNGTIWVYPEGRRGKGERPWGPYTRWGTYLPRWNPAFNGFIGAMRDPVWGNTLPFDAGSHTVAPGNGANSSGSKLNFNTGNPGGAVGSMDWQIPSNGHLQLWPD